MARSAVPQSERVHVVTGMQVTVEPTGPTDEDIAAVIDALSARGALEDALPDGDPDVVHRFGALARRFNPED